MTNDQKVAFLLRAPWTVRSEASPHGPYLVLRIDELPEFVVAGDDPALLTQEFWLALESLLRSYVDEGDPFPLPDSYRSAWDRATNVVSATATPRAESPTSGASLVETPAFAMAC